MIFLVNFDEFLGNISQHFGEFGKKFYKIQKKKKYKKMLKELNMNSY